MNIDADIFSSRYFTKDDPIMKDFAWGTLYAEFFQRGWWSRIYEYEWVKEASMAFFQSPSQHTAIDVATGIQHPNIFIMKDAGFSRVVGTDIFDRESFLYFKHLGNNIEYIKDNLLNPRIEDKFDCVSCISMIEHLPPKCQKTAISNLVNYLKPNGCIMITFDMPGFEYKTDLQLYRDVLMEHGLNVFSKEVQDISIVRTSTCHNASQDLRSKIGRASCRERVSSPV